LAYYKLGIIGCGNMGEGILRGILDSAFLGASQITVYDTRRDRKEYIRNNYGVSTAESNLDVVKSSEYILLAIKPQNLNILLDEIKTGFSGKSSVVISIVAGVTTFYIEEKLNKKVSVIRVMPNSPALLKKGMSAVSKGKNVSESDLKFTLDLIGSVGDYVVIDEKYQNIATALSGSGPAYFFLFCKHLIEAGEKEGLSSEIAKRLVVNTMIGAGELMKKPEADIDNLIKMVASPGGTTEKALKEFGEHKLGEIIKSAVNSAVKRACELQNFLNK